MPIFANRRLQAMLDALDPLLPKGKLNARGQSTRGKRHQLAACLNQKRTDLALSAELEVALLWTLQQCGPLEIEPPWWPTTRNPDAFCPNLSPSTGAVIDIAAFSDGRTSGEHAMRRVARTLRGVANELRRGSGEYLYFQFGEQSGYVAAKGRGERRVKYRRERRVDEKLKLSEDNRERLRIWLRDDFDRDGARLLLTQGKTAVLVTRAKTKQSDVFSFWCTIPAIAYDLEDNALFDCLKDKRKQLTPSADAPDDYVRYVFLADAGSALLGRLYQRDMTERSVCASDIIEHFLEGEKKGGIDAVFVFIPVRHAGAGAWIVEVFEQVPGSVDPALPGRLREVLPPPQLDGRRAREDHLQGAFRATSPGRYVQAKFTRNRSEGITVVHISARALQDLLAGRITLERFHSVCGMTGRNGHQNRFEKALQEARTLRSVQLIPSGIDTDDDTLAFTFEDDPAAREVS